MNMFGRARRRTPVEKLSFKDLGKEKIRLGKRFASQNRRMAGSPLSTEIGEARDTVRARLGRVENEIASRKRLGITERF
jgi:hypothetical protein